MVAAQRSLTLAARIDEMLAAQRSLTLAARIDAMLAAQRLVTLAARVRDAASDYSNKNAHCSCRATVPSWMAKLTPLCKAAPPYWPALLIA
jgi:hypothetical protein